MKYKVFKIEYDTDGEQIDLPTEIEIEISDDSSDIYETLSDKISEITGFLHLGFNYEPVFTKKEIKEFLKTFCTKVRKRESDAYVELMMDNHNCIEYNENQYYVPEGSMMFSNYDSSIKEFLVDKYSL